jgi:catechol 2,3-dioxygenase-like lactoylglutathione lyase family enzyme
MAMRIEHVAWQVTDPPAVAAWYVEHLGFQIRRASTEGAAAHFLADASGRVMIEIYHNRAAPVPDYAGQDPLVLHVAFVCDDVDREMARLIAAGCSAVETIAGRPGEDHIAMLRDPWGLAIQLCKRARPMVE